MLKPEEIKQLIDEDISSEKKRKAAEGQRYYEGEHDILNYRMFYYNKDDELVEDTMRANQRISHPFFTELSDQFASFMLSFKEKPIRAKESAEGLQDHLNTYFDGEFWAEISELITGTYNKGFDYIYRYMSEENRSKYECADAMGVIEVRAKEASDEKNHIIYWYVDRIEKGKNVIKCIQDWTQDEGTYFYISESNTGKIELDKSVALNPRPHVIYTNKETGKLMGYLFDDIPFRRLDYNKKQFSGLKPIKHLIDDYDLHSCSLSNNLIDFDTPLHVVSGYEGNDLDKLQKNLKTKKVVGVDSEGGIEIKTVSIPYEARKAKLEIDEKDIYKFGMGLNTAGLKDASATTNALVYAAYELLNIKANKFQPKLEKLLKDITKEVLTEINEQNGTDYQLKDVEFNLTRNTMTNETENIANEKIKAETKQIEINTILNISAEIGDEKTLQLLCDSMDIDYEEIKDAIEAQKDEGTTIDDANDIIDQIDVQ